MFYFLKRKLKSAIHYFILYKQTIRKNILEKIIKTKIYVEVKFNNNKRKIFLGPYFSSLGGVSHHMQSIQKFSNSKVSLFPTKTTQNIIYKHNLVNYYKTQVESINFKNCVIHSHVDPWFINLSQRAQFNGSRWVHTYHTLYFENDWINGLEDWQKDINQALIEVARHADVKISISYWLKDHLESNYNIKTTYIPNGVDVAKCDLADKYRFIKKYNLKDFILFASGISDIKNAGDFLKLAQALPDKTFVLIGRGISKKALIDKYNIPIGDNLLIMGTMPHEDLLDAIAACKVFVVTSRSEGLPTVLMEAMALERSVVGVNTFGTKEVIHSEEYGYLYEQDNLNDLIQKTKAAFHTSKGKLARERILENYDWKIVAPQIDEIYQKYLR